ncbi:MAG: GntG family PLP-dependent aldolase [Gemmatimonadota bacterium]
MVDLRSDTFTRPTDRMREAMARAEVGDDCFGEDPTVRALEEEAARVLGKERSLFFPSGIMANQVGILAQTGPGEEVLAESSAHLIHYEEGSLAAHGGLLVRGIPSAGGVLDAEELGQALRAPSPYQPRTRLLALENTHLNSGGRAMSVERTAVLAGFAREAGLAVHLDGARIWNAAVALGVDPAELTAPADTVMSCLSKGLGAPVGSVLAGSAEVIERGWRIRRRLGGQMRQAGFLAAAGLHALQHHRERLADDHARARLLAERVGSLPGVRVTSPETNVVMIDLREARVGVSQALAGLKERGVLAGPFGPGRIRAVLHLDVDDAGVELAASAMTDLLK